MSTPAVPQALFVVYSSAAPDIAPEAFSAWYETEHAPSHLEIEGAVLNGRRYKAIDGKHPEWVAVYEAAVPPNVSTSTSIPLPAMLSRLEQNTYTLIATRTHPAVRPVDVPANFLYIAGVEVTAEKEEAFNEWYHGEHADLFMRVPGWVRLRRYRLHGHQELRAVGEEEDSGKTKASYKYLSLHEWKHAEFVDMSEFVSLTNTERANEMKKALVGIEIRVFELQR